MRISDWSSDVCSSDLCEVEHEAEDGNRRELDDEADQLHRHLEHALDRGLEHLRLRRLDQHQPNAEEEREEHHRQHVRSEEHTSELQSLMRISYAVFCLKKTNNKKTSKQTTQQT